MQKQLNKDDVEVFESSLLELAWFVLKILK